MNWPQIFLGCFVIGFVLSVMSFSLGAMHAHFHIHVPWGQHVHGNLFHGGGHAQTIGPINLATITAFLAWFGGTGFLLNAQFKWLLLPTLVGATLIGFCGAAIVFWMMAHLLWSPRENMQRADYRMVGVLGSLTQPIREGGVGELVYTQGGSRKSCGARSDDGRPIEKGSEVVVTGYERGIASVKRWSDLANLNS
jgi:membrane protein implicated in regulation of membrane protease activity